MSDLPNAAPSPRGTGNKMVKELHDSSNLLSVAVVILLTKEQGSTAASMPETLDAIVQEVGALYNYDKKRISIKSHTTQASRHEDAIKKNKALVEPARGRFLGIYNQWELVKIIRKQFDNLRKKDKLVIITDLEIDPGQWRYILWDWEGNEAVISLAAMNPEYWGLKDRYPLATIKHRARTALLDIIGGYLGLRNCDNPACFLYGNVDSVVRLDEMISLGKEHKLAKLANLGFSVRPRDPLRVQEIQRDPKQVQEVQR